MVLPRFQLRWYFLFCSHVFQAQIISWEPQKSLERWRWKHLRAHIVLTKVSCNSQGAALLSAAKRGAENSLSTRSLGPLRRLWTLGRDNRVAVERTRPGLKLCFSPVTLRWTLQPMPSKSLFQFNSPLRLPDGKWPHLWPAWWPQNSWVGLRERMVKVCGAWSSHVVGPSSRKRI